MRNALFAAFLTFAASSSVSAAVTPAPCVVDPATEQIDLTNPACASYRAHIDSLARNFVESLGRASWRLVEEAGRFHEEGGLELRGVWPVTVEARRDRGARVPANIRVVGHGAAFTAEIGADGRCEKVSGAKTVGGQDTLMQDPQGVLDALAALVMQSTI